MFNQWWQSCHQDFAKDLTRSAQQSYSHVVATEFFVSLYMNWNKTSISLLPRHILSSSVHLIDDSLFRSC